MDKPEILLRTTVVEEFSYKSTNIALNYIIEALSKWPGVWWNAYSQKYNVEIKKFPYEARNGFFIDVERRVATHRFTSSGIARRDELFEVKEYEKIVLEPYQKLWYDFSDAWQLYLSENIGVKVQLEIYEGKRTPKLKKYLTDASTIIYDASESSEQ